MSVPSIRPSNNQSAAAQSAPSKARSPQGLAETPDRLEKTPNVSQDNPPSLFKQFLFEPIIQVFKFILRGIFTFIDFLRNAAFEEKKTAEPPLNRETFLNRLQAAPPADKLLIQFRQVYSIQEQTNVYRSIGESHKTRVSWKEAIWERSASENIALGRRLVKENPFLLRDHLFL